MTIDLKAYREMLAQPWGKIMYELIFAQLSHVQNQTVLDFGAGFGITAQHLSQNNTVTAIEPNADLLFADDTQSFTKIQGSLETLKALPDQTFDIIICHNVLEYIPKTEHADYLSEFERLLKVGGELSLIKHHSVGKVLHSVVFNNDIPTALDTLAGKDSYQSAAFTKGDTYSLEELAAHTDLTIKNYQGIRTLYALQPNSFKTQESWLENLTKFELAVANQKPYKDIAFFHHVTLRKES